MTALKAGMKLKSLVCTTEVMVIKIDGTSDLTCGGAAMTADMKAMPTGAPDPAFAGGTAMGKRYQNAAETIEILCVKPGKGALAANGEALTVKAPKALPSSD